jgi:hypothetical protein
LNEFRFQVKQSADWRQYDGPVYHDRWLVQLPHQCDAWEILRVSDYGKAEDYDCCVPHDLAVAAMEQFIAEAQEALGRLRRRERDDHCD